MVGGERMPTLALEIHGISDRCKVISTETRFKLSD